MTCIMKLFGKASKGKGADHARQDDEPANEGGLG
jgi:hypothetical protein